MERSLALESESVDEASAQLIDGLFGVVTVITVPFAGDQHMQCVMDVVIPLSGVSLRLTALTTSKVT
jgi:hypothetical protein